MRARGLTLVAFLLTGATFLAGLGLLPLTEPDEGRNATVASEMLASGRWLVPTLGQMDYLDKPAFFFKAVGVSLALFGHNEVAARLPSALAACALALLLFAFVRRAYGVRVAALAVVVLATTPLFVAFARLVIFDMMLTLFVSASILAGFLAESSEGPLRRRWYLVAAAAAGLATLVKGPVGFVVPVLVHLATARWNGQRGVLRRSLSLANVAIFLLLVLPWFIGVSLRVPEFPYYGIAYETLARVTTRVFRRTQPPWFYAHILGLGALPWTLLVPGAVVAAWRGRRSLAPADRLCIVWALGVTIFFSLPSAKQPAYVLSVCLPLAAGVARMLDAALARPAGRAARHVRLATFVFGLVLALAAGVALFLHQFPEILARIPGVTDAGGTLFLPFLVTASITGATLAILALAASLARRPRCAVATLAVLLPVVLVVASPAAVAYADARSSRELARRILASGPAAEIVCLGCYPSALPFYLNRQVFLVSRDGSELRSNYALFVAARSGDLPPGVISPEELSGWLAGRRHPVYLLGGDDEQQVLGAIAAGRGVGVTKLAPDVWGTLLPPSSGS